MNKGVELASGESDLILLYLLYKEVDMKCIKYNPTHTAERCTFPPYIQSNLDKGKVLCRYHAMEELVTFAWKNKLKVRR